MKWIKQVTIAVVWCVVSLGCVAEEVKQPASSEAAILKNTEIDKHLEQTTNQSEISPSGAMISVAENELHFTSKVKEVIFDCRRDGICLFVFDDIVVEFIPYIARNKNMGKVHWPIKSSDKKDERYQDRQVEVYCKKGESRDFSRIYPEISTVNFCSILKSEKFYIKF